LPGSRACATTPRRGRPCLLCHRASWNSCGTSSPHRHPAGRGTSRQLRATSSRAGRRRDSAGPEPGGAVRSPPNRRGTGRPGIMAAASARSITASASSRTSWVVWSPAGRWEVPWPRQSSATTSTRRVSSIWRSVLPALKARPARGDGFRQDRDNVAGSSQHRRSCRGRRRRQRREDECGEARCRW